MIAKVRVIGLLFFALAAIGVGFGAVPEDKSYSSDISSAIFRAEMNNENTEGAPQQQVVNGWAAQDLLEIIAKQGERDADNRIPALLTIAVLAGIWSVLTAPKQKSEPGPAAANGLIPVQPQPQEPAPAL